MKKLIYGMLGLTAFVLIGAVIIILVMGPQAVMGRVMGASAAPDGLDTAVTRRTERGLFEVSYSSAETDIPINQLHSWTVHLETADGEPIEQAEITVDGGMPQHNHGLPTQPQVTQDLGDGNYLVEGLKFHMPGWWEVKFHITAGGQSDRVTFNLMLP